MAALDESNVPDENNAQDTDACKQRLVKDVNANSWQYLSIFFETRNMALSKWRLKSSNEKQAYDL